jgi:hypothetical protein
VASAGEPEPDTRGGRTALTAADGRNCDCSSCSDSCAPDHGFAEVRVSKSVLFLAIHSILCAVDARGSRAHSSNLDSFA